MDINKSLLIRIGNNIRNYREAINISQEELAYRAGLNRTHIGMIERAEKNITILTLEKIAKALDKSICDLTK